MLTIKDTGAKGRGVFAEQPYARSEIVEVVPVIVISGEGWRHLEETALGNYYFNWEEGGAAIALGHGSLYNHSYTPNARYLKHFAEQRLSFVALRDIAVGEEITVNYNGDPESRAPLWFDAA